MIVYRTCKKKDRQGTRVGDPIKKIVSFPSFRVVQSQSRKTNTNQPEAKGRTTPRRSTHNKSNANLCLFAF